MGTRGRKSSSDLAIATANPLQTIPLPDAPYDLTDEQADEWRAVVNRLAPDHFPRETWGLLSQYCRHVVNARRIAQWIGAAEKCDAIDVAEYDRLLKMQDRESRAIATLSSKMRISQASTMRNERTRKPSLVSKPWES